MATTTLQTRILEILELPGMTVGRLAKAAGVTSSAVSQWKSGKSTAMKVESAAGLERLTGIRALWIASGHGPKHPEHGVAHELSHQPRRIAPKQIPWEEIVKDGDASQLGELFVSAMPDDAASPEFPKSMEVVWSTTKAPQFGSLVMVRDKHGRLHAREYRQGSKPNHWIAAALNRAYASFDSEDDGLRIVAVAAFRALP